MANPHDFGAVGDGQTDDTAALQHALRDGDGTLELGPRAYRIRRPLVVDFGRRFQALRGQLGASKLVMDGPGPAVEFVGTHQGTAQPSSVTAATWDRERMPLVTDLEILGTHPQADGIRLQDTLQATLRQVLIRRCRIGVHLVKRNRNLLLLGSHIYDCHDTGVFLDRCNLHQVIVAHNHISYCRRAGIRQRDGDVHNVQITGNDIEYNSGGQEPSGEIVLEAPAGIISEFTISANTLQATPTAPGANLLVWGPDESPPTSARLLTVTGNVIGSRTRNLDWRNVSRASVTGNTIYDGRQLSIALDRCRNVVLASNTIATRPAGWNSRSGDGVLLEDCIGCSLHSSVLNDCRPGEAAEGGSVTLRRCCDSSVADCQLLDPAVRGIDVIGSVGCRVANNTVRETDQRGRMQVAIRIQGGHSNLVQHNLVHRGQMAGIECEATAGWSVANREVSD